jgi:hypothetical protein
LLFIYHIVILEVHCDIHESAYNISFFNSSPLSILLYPPPPFLEYFQQSHFSIFICEYIVFLPHSPSYTLSLYPPPSHCTNPQTGPALPSCSLFLKKDIVCLFKIAIQGVSLCYFYVYMYYNPNWFIPFIFLLSTLVPFLWFQQV